MRYDVVYYGDRATVQEHFCREWDEAGGCYGTNPNHGMTWKEAVKEANRYNRVSRLLSEEEKEYE